MKTDSHRLPGKDNAMFPPMPQWHLDLSNLVTWAGNLVLAHGPAPEVLRRGVLALAAAQREVFETDNYIRQLEQENADLQSLLNDKPVMKRRSKRINTADS